MRTIWQCSLLTLPTEAERHMATVTSGALPADRVVTIGNFVSRVYLPWIKQHKRPSAVKGYRMGSPFVRLSRGQCIMKERPASED